MDLITEISLGLCGAMTVAGLAPVLFNFIMSTLPQKVVDMKAKRKASRQEVKSDSPTVASALAKYFSAIKGNEVAKKKIIDAILGWLSSKKNCVQHGTGGLVLYLVGPSGVGKSMAANAICKALLGPNAAPFRISLSSINSQSSLSVKDQLTMSIKRPVWGQHQVTIYSPLVNQLKYNPKTVIWIDEYDKLSAKDHTLDDLIWDIRDSGYIVINGEVIDCSNAVFVITSNEDPEKLWGLSSEEKDVTATNVNHLDAFKCRVTPIVFEFPDLTSYVEVVSDTFSELLKSYEDKFNIRCTVTKHEITSAAQSAKSERGGIRKTQDYVIALAAALEKYRIEKNISQKVDHIIDVKAIFCPSAKDFLVQ